MVVNYYLKRNNMRFPSFRSKTYYVHLMQNKLRQYINELQIIELNQDSHFCYLFIDVKFYQHI